MIIIGCDFHTRFQQIAMLDSESGEMIERRLEHEGGEAQAFYAGLAGARVGMESTGYARWFERMLAEQAVGQLCGVESEGKQQRGQTAARFHQQARQLDAAILAGGSGADRLAIRSGATEGLSTIEIPPRSWGGEGGHCTKAGGAAVLEAARSSSVQCGRLARRAARLDHW